MIKKILACLLALHLSIGLGYAAWNFTNDQVLVTDGDALTLPDGDWSIAIRFRINSNSGTGTQNLFNLAVLCDPNNVYFSVFEASHATTPNNDRYCVEDGGGDNYGGNGVVGTATPGSSTAWQVAYMERSGATFTAYIDNTSSYTNTNANVDGIDSANGLKFGRDPADAFPCDNCDIGEFRMWNTRVLSSAERGALDRFSFNCFPGAGVYLPAVREYIEIIGGLTTTNTGTTNATHPPVIYCN